SVQGVGTAGGEGKANGRDVTEAIDNHTGAARLGVNRGERRGAEGGQVLRAGDLRLHDRVGRGNAVRAGGQRSGSGPSNEPAARNRRGGDAHRLAVGKVAAGRGGGSQGDGARAGTYARGQPVLRLKAGAGD